MKDLDRRTRLTVTIDAAVALLKAIGIERYLGVQHEAAVALQIDAFARGVRREQNAHGSQCGVRAKLGDDTLAVVVGHPAVHQCEALAAIAREAGVDEDAMQPLLCRAILREDDDPFARPRGFSGRPFSEAPAAQLLDEDFRFSIGALRRARGPLAQTVEERALVRCEGVRRASCDEHRFFGRVVEFVVECEVVVRVVVGGAHKFAIRTTIGA